MELACCVPFALAKHPTQKTFNHELSLHLPRQSSKMLSMAHYRNKDSRSLNPVFVPHSVNPAGTQRPIVDFPSSDWDGHFISSSSTDLKPAEIVTDKKIEDLQKDVKNTLFSVLDPSQQLVFIDKIQRLGVAYHFQDEINEVLKHVYENTNHEEGDLYSVALRFRLLRQAGHCVSPDVFRKFLDENYEFVPSLRDDLEGLLSLYEASHLSCKGEKILDDGNAFSSQHLKSLAEQVKHDSMSQVRRSLDLPLHKRISRFETAYYISVYEKVDDSENDVLLQFAKRDYNALQLMHQSEIKQLSRWWKELDILSKLPFKARDKLVEVYAIVMSVIPEPKYSDGRIFTAKYMALFNIIDDIFDSYGTTAELQSFTNAISRWDVNDTENLPGFAEVVLVETYNVLNEIQELMANRGLEYTVPYFKRQAQYYVKCLLDEAKLFHSNRVPTLEDWLQISGTTIGVKLINIGLLLCQWDLATKEAMDWCISDAKMNCISARCGRILNDINSSKSERERGNMASSVTCYMKEHGVQEVEAIENLRKMVDEGWKEMNQECLNPTTTIPLGLLMIPVQTVRMCEFVYMYGDGYTNSGGHVKEMIASLLVNPVRT